MLKVIRSLLLKIVDDIDAGNSNITEGEAIEIVDNLRRFTDKEKRLSKYAACEYLNVSRATFDNYVREGKLPRGKHEIGFKELEDRNYPRRHEDDGFMDVFDSRSNRFGDRFRDSGMRGNDMDRIIKYMRHSMNDGEHFTESEAMDLVSDMYHTEGGRKYSGEKFDIHKAKEICERHRGVIPVSATPTDVYAAINSQYHDYVELFKSWFGDNVDQKIIESAIIFWFKDVDCKSRNKVVSYFKEY